MEVASEEQGGSVERHANELRVLAADGRGSLLELYMPFASTSQTDDGVKHTSAPSTASAEQQVHVLSEARGPGAIKGDYIVQKMARGRLQGVDVIALARKDGRVDVCSLEDGRTLVTVRHDRMKKGIHRWIGLAVAYDGIFACTSAGHFRFFSISRSDGKETQATLGFTSLEEEITSVDLPEPLQQLTFQPPSDPSHFAYGGEEIPLSVWDARQAINTRPLSASSTTHNGNHQTHGIDATVTTEDGEHATNGKARKRKRAAENRAKARELLWGEIWRAKNLPNDNLSLPQRPDINSVAFVGQSVSKLVVGTRQGMIRVFDTQTQRKHTEEHRIFSSEKGAVKGVICNDEGTRLVVTDTTGKMFIVDVESGTVIGQIKGINGAVLGVELVPLPLSKSASATYLLSASADRLARLHNMPKSRRGAEKGSERTDTLHFQFLADGLTALMWDGRIPSRDVESIAQAEEQMDDDDEADEEEVWDAMQTTATSATNGHDDDHDHDAKKHEGRAKRRR